MTAVENTKATHDLVARMLSLSGTQARLAYIAEHCDPDAVAVAEEIVRLSRLADYTEDGPDGLAWASYSQAQIARRTIDALLRDVFQGQKDHLRDHMLGVAAKVDRKTIMEPAWEAEVVLLRARLAAVEALLDETDADAREHQHLARLSTRQVRDALASPYAEPSAGA